MSTHKGAEAALSAAHASQSENVPENSHADGSHAQSVDSTVIHKTQRIWNQVYLSLINDTQLIFHVQNLMFWQQLNMHLEYRLVYKNWCIHLFIYL